MAKNVCLWGVENKKKRGEKRMYLPGGQWIASEE